MQRILVTGCAGFLGSHVCELLLAKGFAVVGIDNFDPFYPAVVKRKNLDHYIHHPDFVFYEGDITRDLGRIREKNIDAVIHLAARAGVRPSIDDPVGYTHANITGTQMVLEFMREKGIRKFIFSSSSSVYGNNKKTPFSEEDNVDHPISPYAFTKKACELLNFSYHHLFGIDVVNLRLFTVYGPRQRPDLAIHKFVRKITAGEPVAVFGNGDTSRDYTYVADTVLGIYKALEYCFHNEKLFLTLNLGNNHPVKLNDLVEKIFTAMGREKNVVYSPMQAGDVDITYADIEKARQLLGYSPATGIDAGLKKFIAWFSENSRESND
jgi:nucleoside-diphosphate-sugar epimerase